ncbi:dihydrouridine synthase (dus) protein, partial [Toxoplasma gondii MAS]
MAGAPANWRECKAAKDRQRKKKKKRQDGRFWDSIGRPRFVMAPMVDASELAFR